MELKKIVKSTSYLVTSKLVQFLIGLVKSKIGAVYLGTTGMGIFNQVQYLTTMVSQTTLMSMNDGLVKQIAENKDNNNFKEIIKGLIKAYSGLIIYSVLLAFIVCLVFAKTLTIFFLGDYNYLNYYLFGVASVPILIVNSLSFAILKSYKATKEISRANIFGSIISLFFFVPLVYFFGIAGAATSVAINFALMMVINNYQARKLIFSTLNIRFKDLFKAKTDRKYRKELLYFALFGATSGFIYIGSESVCRSLVVNQIGIDKLGVYSPIISWSGLLTGFILPAIQVYLYPRFSECKSDKEISGIVNDYFYLITLLMVPFLFISIPYRDILIKAFYSKEFIDAGAYLPWHFIGMLFYMWWYILAMVFTPTGRIKTHSILVTIMSVLNIAIVYFLVPKIGLYGWMLKFIVSPIIFLFIYFFYLRVRIKLVFNKKILLLMGYTLLVPIALILINGYFVKYFICFVLVFATVFFLSKSERAFVTDRIAVVYKKIFRN